jgi:hypothetical protein
METFSKMMALWTVSTVSSSNREMALSSGGMKISLERAGVA